MVDFSLAFIFYRYIVALTKRKFKRSKVDPAIESLNVSTNSTFFLSASSPQRENTILTDLDKKELNEKAVLIYLEIQKSKVKFEDTIEEEYIEKVNFVSKLHFKF